MFAKVAIDLALDRLFTYSVPAELEKKLAVGQLLLVPFGHRKARGFALAVSDTPPEDASYSIKPVERIEDETPFFSRTTLELVKTIAAYYSSPIELALKSALPAAVLKPGIHAKEEKIVEPSPDFPADALSAREKELYAEICRIDGGRVAFVVKELKTTAATLKSMAAKGAIKISPRRVMRSGLRNKTILPSKPLELNSEQKAALDAIVSSARGAMRPVLVHGVTGSGKTEVYLQAIAETLSRGKGAIALVPEIALTPQTVQRFASRFGRRVAVLHSGMSDGERYDEWHRIRKGEAQVAIGPRSAVFAPVANLGLIIVDEEHEPSYKQNEQPSYNARDVAVMRGRFEGAQVVLGSATPSLESWTNVARGKYSMVQMSRRAGSGMMPNVLAVEMSGEENRGKMFSRELVEAMRLRLRRGEQTILFLNRRGYSRTVECPDCGWTAKCPSCSVSYTYHKADSCLRCHVCGGWTKPAAECPQCGCKTLSYRGIGTQKVEDTVRRLFPRARVLRMDADSTRGKDSHDELLGKFRRHEADILLGTQMIAKGLDFPNVTLVGVLNADNSLNIPDFRASERTFQLISQVAGRAGRAELPGEAIIQTYNRNAPAIACAIRGDYAAFAKNELESRREFFYPPFCHLATLNFKSKDPDGVAAWAGMYAEALGGLQSVRSSGAAPNPLEKADGWYRWQIVLRAEKPGAIVKAWKWISRARPLPQGVRCAIDMDAMNLI